MISRHVVNPKFRYRTNEYNHRLGFAEEQTVKIEKLYKRIDYYKNVFVKELKLQPYSNLKYYVTQSSFDTFAIILAAIELDINLVDKDPDCVIHNLPDAILKELRLDEYRCVAYWDISDLHFDENVHYEQKGVSTLFGISQKDINLDQLYVRENVLHTKYCVHPMLIVYFLLPSLTKESLHICIGYNDPEQGMGKVAMVVQKMSITDILLPCEISMRKFLDEVWLRKINIDNLKLHSYDESTLYTPVLNIHDIELEDTLDHIPDKYRLQGKILKDKINGELYFQFTKPMDKSVAKIKIQTMNKEIEKKTGKTISKFSYLESDSEDAIQIFRSLDV
tara:strand:+ start:61 stop:1065 length:1005 start_codon:yes stop_codon:yes gene_type:complete